ncbi:MAG: LemA family protein [Gemmatimonadales bacterium]
MTILLLVLAALAAWVIVTFNRLTRLRQLSRNAWADIDVQLKRRHDLIPAVVATVQGHAGYERETLEALVAARTRALQTSGPAARYRAEHPVQDSLGRIFAVAEAYPDLRAAASFAGLQRTLTEVEDHLQNARRYYNAVVRDLNTALQQFPTNLLAGAMGFRSAEFFGIDDDRERAVPRVATVLLLCAALASTPNVAAAQRSYAIERLDATIRVEPDAELDVTETITVRFTGSWNGIYRTIPVVYRTPRGLNWTLGVRLAGARDQYGRPLRVETSRERHYIKYQIWVPGAQDATRTVVLRYRATNGLRFFDTHDELYWNVTGDEWEVPIQAASAQIELPAGSAGIRAMAFSGAYGATRQVATVEIEGRTVRLTMPTALGYREGLTAVVGWNKGVVHAPGAGLRALRVIASNWPLAIPIPVFLLAWAIWWRRGRDPRRRPVAVQYRPPPGLTPAEAGTLLDSAADLRDVTATLVDLAVRGYLKIEEREAPKLFGLMSSHEYTLHRLPPPEDGTPLAPHEQRVLDGIFAGRGDRVDLSDLKDEFYRELPRIRDGIFQRLLGGGLYHARPDRVRRHWMVAAIVCGGLVAVGGASLAPRFLMTALPFIIAGVLVAVILLCFSLIMPARTDSGTRALEAVLGFEEFLRRVESQHLKRVIIGHPELFDQYLPFAMAFGVEGKWARAFEGIYTEPPRWYVGGHVMGFSPSRFSGNLSQLASTAGAAMTAAPRSAGGSGFGGGGFSGGGGGGGGGGAF